MGHVVVVGSINTDYVVRISHLPKPGETVGGGALAIHPGGKGANQAHAAARLGADVAMIGAIGADSGGEQELAALRQDGVDTGPLLSAPGPSGIAVILVDDQGENMIAVAPGANNKLKGDVVAARLSGLLTGRSVVLASLEVPTESVAAAAGAARQVGATMIINPAPGMPLPADVLNGSILTPNEGEIRLLVPDASNEDAAVAAVLAAGARAVIVTRGGRGASLYERDLPEFRVPAPHIVVVDTVGAGDTFNGALAVALSDSQPLQASVRMAVAAGAAACTGEGARGGLPTTAQVAALLKAMAAANDGPSAAECSAGGMVPG